MLASMLVKKGFLCFAVLLNLFCFSLEREFAESVDVVYLWVDGNDPVWREVKEQYLVAEEESSRTETTQDAATDNRFADHEELKYSLRSIWKYAPFVHHIYIVTMQQKPSWLQDHPMITFVDHREIFLDLSMLPTFNSQAIESNLHRIPGLQEHFLYFNDDVFLGRPVVSGDFFTVDECVKVLFEASLSPSGPPNQLETTYRRAWRNTNALLDARYGCHPRYRLCHAPFALKKSYLELSEGEFPFVFALNSSHRFRSTEDYNVINGFVQYHWFHEGKVLAAEISNRMVTLRNDDTYRKTQRVLAELQEKPPHTFCLEDNMVGRQKKTEKVVKDFLEALYPEPAPWEVIVKPTPRQRKA